MSKHPKDRPRLGRGLNSLLSMSDSLDESASPGVAEHERGVAPVDPASALTASAGPETPYRLIDPATVAFNPHQPRKQINEASLAELAESLKANGVIQAIVVREVDGQYQLIAGERRLRAARLAQLDTIPAIVKEVDAYSQAQMALVENIQRENLNPIDRAEAYQTLIEQLGLTQAELAGRLGEERSVIANHLRLLHLSPDVRSYVRDGDLSTGHAKVLAGIDDGVEQLRLARLAIDQDLSVRNLERVVEVSRLPVKEPVAANKPASAAHYAELEKSISQTLGLRVQLRSGAKKGRGRLVLHYGSLDQFDELMKRLGVAME